MAFQNLIIALPCLTLSTNLTATALVLWRVSYVPEISLSNIAQLIRIISALHITVRKVERADGGQGLPVTTENLQYRRLLLIIIESGGMYCLTWLVFLCLAIARSPVKRVFMSVIGQLTVCQLFTTITANVNLLTPVIFYRVYTRY
jgi:hypothetical protein